ncbi:hypothetical protein CRUP_004437 [Coryphaenoides rupestris]|nr:hypothetical protein CRUP_004437 [Coryphaenoides rupestris]
MATCLVESLYGLQGERSRLRGELRLLHSQLEEKEQDRHSRILAFQQQGATDSEKRVLCLSVENDSLKQSLSVTQGLLQQLSAIPSQSSNMLIKENESLRSRVQQLETSLQERGEQLSRLERHSEKSEWRRGEELRKREERVRELQLLLDRERDKEPVVKYVTQTVEVESPSTLKQLSKAKQKNELLSEKLSTQNEQCKHLEEQIRKSDEYSCNLQHKIAAYECEISKLREELLKEISHLEERKEEAVKAASSCSAEHFQSLQEQFFDHRSDPRDVRSQQRLVEKYRKEVALRRKYHETTVELKVMNKGKDRSFELDKVFHPQATQEEGSVENPGINQRALKHLFKEIEDRKDMWCYTVNVSSVEIYNEVLRDLLSKDGEKLDIKINPDGTGQLHVPGLRVTEVKGFHTIKKALRGNQTHIPFRNSRLTYLLQDSLGKGNKTAMVVQVSALESNVGETLCSLKFAQKVCKVELGPAARKIESGAGQCD